VIFHLSRAPFSGDFSSEVRPCSHSQKPAGAT